MAGGWTSPELLTRFDQLAGRPATDIITDAVKYQFLSDAEAYTIDRIAVVCPTVLYPPPAQLTTTDGGLTFNFGQDETGNLLFPIGRAGIYPSLQAIPRGAWTPGVDYLDEGLLIRMPNAVPYTGTLYWYGLIAYPPLNATTDPVLQPPPIRKLIVRRAVADFAETGNIRNEALANRESGLFEKELGEAATLLRKRFRGGGALGRLLVPWGMGLEGSGM